MERDFRPAFGGGEGLFMAAMEQSMDDACFNVTCSGGSMSTLLSGNQKKPLRLEYDIGGSPIGFPVIPTSDSSTFSFFSEEFPALSQNQITERSAKEDRRLRSVDLMEKLKMPKDEPLENAEIPNESYEPFKFVTNGFDSIPKLYDANFHHLPDLHSVEKVHDEFSLAESSQKRVRSYSSSDSYTLDAIVKSFKLSNYLGRYKAPDALLSPVVPQSELARQRRQKISDKTRCLQKLMPWDKKMDMATMLEEAYKYVKFLQAQISVLQSMPCDSSFAVQQKTSGVGAVGGLGMLNRQQLLQVLVNSPVAQTMLCSQACCVFSIEQLVLLKKIADRRVLMQHKLFDPSKLS